MKLHFSIYFLMLFELSAFAQTEHNDHQVIILGNIADITEHGVFLDQLDIRINAMDSPFTVLLNGDISNNDTPKGVDNLALTKRIMDLMSANALGNLFILPGDRDWNSSGKGGHKKVLAIESEIKSYKKKNKYSRVTWLAPDGCPGPYTIEVDEHLVIIAINTQWWNHPFDKPRPSDGICDIITNEHFMEELEDAVEENTNKNVLIVGHHPFKSLGNYGGHFSIGKHLSPTPIIGTYRVAYRKKVGSVMDISNENLESFVEGMKNLFYFNKNLIYASSHEHNQQILKNNSNFMINSGALEQGSYVAKDPSAWLRSTEPGWIELTYKRTGVVEAEFIALNQKNEAGKSIILFESIGTSTSLRASKNPPINLSYIPEFEEGIPAKYMSENYSEDEVVVAGEEYLAGRWKEIWWGKHYRSTWITPITVPYLNLDTTFNGLRIYKKGGGRQTTSLKFRSNDNTVYVFRSVNKDPSKAFNYQLRPTIVSGITRDQTSTQQPFGAMAVDPLLDKINILHAHPTLYLLPDDNKLGSFQHQYGNLLGMLEENPGKKNDLGIRFGGADKIVKSNKLFKDLYADHDNKVAENEFVRARSFDILVGDWSKHEDNWKWAKYETDDGNIYHPIPRDRDHVFSKQDGFWPYLGDREWGIQNIENFDYKVKGLKSLMNQAKHMDRFLASEATRETWIDEARFIQESITENDIEDAVKEMPSEIYEISGFIIADKLKQRIKDLPNYAEDYYEILAKEVDVTGSNKREYFEIKRDENGTVSVAMYNRNKEGLKGKTQLYYRKFFPKETKEVRVYGLGGGDIFDISGSGSAKIKIRVFGGSGLDIYTESGTHKPFKTLIYDKGKETELNLGGGAKRANYWNKDIYEYDRKRFQYNSYFPLIYLSYSSYNGITLAGNITFTKQSYEKDLFAAQHSFGGGISTEGNKKIEYMGRFHHVINKWDILLQASAADPEFHNNFYGLGNSSIKDDNLESVNYYDIRYSKYTISTGISREFWKDSELKLIFGIESVNSEELDYNTILDDAVVPGAFETQTSLPVEIGLDIDLRDRAGLSYNGTRFFINYTNASVLSDNGDSKSVFDYGYLDSFMEYYISSVNKKKLTLALRFGGVKAYGDIPFYKMPNLGGSNGLRGYVNERFTGDSKLYFNSELKWQLHQRYTTFFPMKVGVKAFYDVGKVFYSGDVNENKRWHKAYGGGLYFVPFDEAYIISLSLGFSEEESFHPIVGFGKSLK